MARGHFLLIVAAASLVSCGKITAPKKAPLGAALLGGTLDLDFTLRTESGEEELLAITRRARETLPDFISALEKPGPGEEGFRVKYPMPAGGESGVVEEHIWLGDIVFRNGEYHGTVVSRPYYIAPLSAGDRIKFSIEKISDWMYLRDGRIVGGESIKYLIERIGETERDEELAAFYELFGPAGPPVSHKDGL
jgi:uncharacterized protein YegJ (DUF2314 family)